MSLRICGKCANHYHMSELSCPHCKSAPNTSLRSTSLAFLLGMSLSACGGAEKDSAEDTAGEDTSVVTQPENAAAYGVPEDMDIDGDGFWAEEDCNDEDPSIYPGAPETPGDGVDSNCDGEDDT